MLRLMLLAFGRKLMSMGRKWSHRFFVTLVVFEKKGVVRKMNKERKKKEIYSLARLTTYLDFAELETNFKDSSSAKAINRYA